MPKASKHVRARRALVAACLLSTSLACRGGSQGGDGPLNLVLVSLDTLRADHLGCYGYARGTSPNIDALASRATLFRNAFSTASKTAESHMSMFTSLYPTAHGVVTLWEAKPGEEVATIGPSVRTLAQELHDRGYATVGFHSNAFVDAKFGFDRGFDFYEISKLGPALRWLEENAADGPFFLFFHTYHVHDPYTPGPPFDAQFAGAYDGRIVHESAKLEELAGTDDWTSLSSTFWSFVDKESPRDVDHLRALYDAEIAEIDKSVARLFEAVERLAPNTLLVLLSDHGEEFGEHGQFKHRQVYDELLRVPWIVRAPGQTAARVVEDPVSTIDLAPTVLDLLSLPPVDQFEGRSLRPLIEAAAPASPAAGAIGRAVAAQTAHASEAAPYIFSELPMLRLATIRDQRFKLIAKEDVLELYDYRADPGERRNLLASAADAATPEVSEASTRLRSEMERRLALSRDIHARHAVNAPRRRLDEKTVEQMRALGYIE